MSYITKTQDINRSSVENKTYSVMNDLNITDVKRKNYEWTMIFAQDIVTSFSSTMRTTNSTNNTVSSKHCKVMRQSVQELLERHDILFKAMVNKLDVCEKTVFLTFVKVADEVFEDGDTNWGRIVTVYAFAARLAMACRHSSNDVFLQNIAVHTGKYIWRKLGKWIIEHGGWDAFVEAFSTPSPVEDTIWRGLLFTAIGLGAMATVLAVR